MNKIIIYFFIFLFHTISVYGADQTKRIFKILILDSQQISPYTDVKEATLNHLAELGYSRDKNLKLETINIGNFSGATENTLKSFKDQNYDLYFVNGTTALQGTLEFLKNHTQHPPIIFANVTDPIGLGAINAFNKSPSKGITGVAYPVSVSKRFELLKILMPKAKTIGFIYADMPQSNTYIKWVDGILKSDDSLKKLHVIYKKIDFIKSANGHKRMVFLAENMIKELSAQVDVFVSPNDQLGSSYEFSKMVYTKSKIPLLGLANEPYTIASLSPDFNANGKSLAKMISRIFQGEQIKNIPPQESRSKICLNYSVIKRYPTIELPRELRPKKDDECFYSDDLKAIFRNKSNH